MAVIKDCPYSEMDKCSDAYGCRGYCKPETKEWSELTKEECFELCVKHKDAPFSLLLAVQDKLKEKNT